MRGSVVKIVMRRGGGACGGGSCNDFGGHCFARGQLIVTIATATATVTTAHAATTRGATVAADTIHFVLLSLLDIRKSTRRFGSGDRSCVIPRVSSRRSAGNSIVFDKRSFPTAGTVRNRRIGRQRCDLLTCHLRDSSWSNRSLLWGRDCDLTQKWSDGNTLATQGVENMEGGKDEARCDAQKGSETGWNTCKLYFRCCDDRIDRKRRAEIKKRTAC